MSDDLISLEDAIETIASIDITDGTEPVFSGKQVIALLKDLYIINPQEQKIGHWIWCFGSHKCSNCKEYTCFSHKELLKYCPNCGAKMIKPQEGSDKE